jgi:hypothetical protein
MNNSFDDMEDDIRPPDEVKRETLIYDTRDDFEKELDNAIQASMEAFIEQQKIHDKYEEDVMNEFIKEKTKRKEIFEKLLFDLNKLIKYDKEIKEIYEIIYPIIELYCNQYIEVIHLDQITHDKIFTILNKIRINKNGLDSFKNIILIE